MEQVFFIADFHLGKAQVIQEIRPLNEVASSHLTRRCFVGNLY